MGRYLEVRLNGPLSCCREGRSRSVSVKTHTATAQTNLQLADIISFLLLWDFGSCPITSVCPYDGATTTFTGHTANRSGCIYEEYKHASNTSWEKRFCARE